MNDEEENMSTGEKLEHILATIVLLIVAIIMLAVAFPANAADPHHDHGNGTDYIVINKENDSGKYVIGTILISGAIYCVVTKCWKKDSEPVQKEEKLTVTPDVSGVRLYQ